MAKKTKIEIELEVDDKGTTKKVSQNSKKLGDNLGKTADGAEKVKQKSDEASKSTGELGRNMRGTGQMSSNTTKNFSKMQQGMGGLVGAYATLAAQVFAVSAAFQFLQTASDFRNLIAGQEALGSVTGTTFKTISNEIVKATDAQLKYADAAKAAAIGSAAGLTSSQLTDLGAAAKNVSFALGRDLTDSFNRLIRGVTKAEPELLDELGIILRLEPAIKAYARELGKAEKDLNAFERTQAVTNEVLDQSNRKFADIARLMDPNAAVLAQFAKSFDELVNAFKVGVIDTLTPILSFLSKNTEALAAALTLAAIPIVKALIPNLKIWSAQTADLAKTQRDQASSYVEGIKKQRKAMKTFLNDQKQQSQAAADASKKILGGQQSTGLNFLTGEDTSKRAQAAANKILVGAEKQTKDGADATTGYLKGKNAEQVASLRGSYNEQMALTKTHNQKTRQVFAASRAAITGGFLGLRAAWAGTLSFMTSTAAVAGVVINTFMSFLAVVGALTLVVQAAIGLYRAMVPLSEQQKKDNAIIEEQSSRYSTLTEEMKRNRLARETLLVGSERQTNIGQTLQGADVSKVIQELNEFSTVSKDTDGYDEQRTALRDVVLELGRVDPAFAILNKNLREGTSVSDDTAKSLKRLANEFINAGQAIANLPNLIKEADTAFSNLSTSMVKNTPLTAFIQAQGKATQGLFERSRAAKQTEKSLEGEIAVAENLQTKQEGLLDTLYAPGSLGRRFYDEADDAKKDRMRKQRLHSKNVQRRQQGKDELVDFSKQAEFRSDKELEAAKKASAESRRAASDDLGQGIKRDKILRDAVTFENKILKLREAQNIEALKATKAQTLGVTVQGKINNLGMQETAIKAKVLKAEEAVLAAEFAKKNAIEGTEESANKAFDVAEEQLEIAKEQAKIDNLKLARTKALLLIEQKILSTQIQKIALEQRLAGGQRAETNLQAFQGTRENRIALLDQQQENRQTQLRIAEEDGKILGRKFTDAYNTMLDENAKTITGSSEATFQTLNTEQQLNAARQAGLEIQLSSEAAALRANTNTKEALTGEITINKSRFDLQNDLTLGEIEQLKIKSEGISLSREEEIFQRLKAQHMETQNELSVVQLQTLRQQAGEINDLETTISTQERIRDSIKGSMTDAFDGIITGAKSAKDAFADMGRAILGTLAKIVAEMIVAKIVSSSLFSAFGFGPAADGGITASAKKGGIYSMAGGGYTSPLRNYNRGGVARGPHSGYNAVLHGNEAVVPLPDNRHIPVELSGSTGSQNNVTVNVSMNSDGTASSRATSSGPDASALGNAVAKAVQLELQQQQRAGGMLSPYGVA